GRRTHLTPTASRSKTSRKNVEGMRKNDARQTDSRFYNGAWYSGLMQAGCWCTRSLRTSLFGLHLLPVRFAVPVRMSAATRMVRAALSVPSNIAEACGRGTVAEFRRFLIYARGSAQETLTQLRVGAALDSGNAAAFHALENRVALVLKMLGRLIAHPPPDR